MKCFDCDLEIPKATYEGDHFTCECGRRYSSYCDDFSATHPWYRWQAMPKGVKYRELPGLPGVPIVERERGK